MGSCCYSDKIRTGFDSKQEITRPSMPEKKEIRKLSAIWETADTKNQKPQLLSNQQESPANYTSEKREIVLQPNEDKKLSSRVGSVGFSGYNYSKLKQEKYSFNVHNPSLSNSSVVRRLEHEEPNDSFFKGIPIFSKLSAVSQHQGLDGKQQSNGTRNPDNSTVGVLASKK